MFTHSRTKSQFASFQPASKPGSQRVPAAPFVAAALALLSLLCAAVSARAQTYTTLYSFQGPSSEDAEYPWGALFRDSDGNLYGTSIQGGADNFGAVFKVTPSGQESVLYSFSWGSGANPISGIMGGKNGDLYGTTTNYARGNGSWFELTPSGSQMIIHPFWPNSEGAVSQSGLIIDKLGNLFGTTNGGGNTNCDGLKGCGVVFKINPSDEEQVIYSFRGPEGAYPNDTLAMDTEGNLYGTTYRGGIPNDIFPNGCGVVFKVAPSGSESILYAFKCGTDGGGWVDSPLIADRRENVYGVNPSGGVSIQGSIFKVTSQGKFVILHTFPGTSGGGWFPTQGVTADKFGNLYGVTVYGGTAGCGTIYRLSASGTFSTLYNFPCGANGLTQSPNGKLILDEEGNFYGTTYGGDSILCGIADGACGAVFKFTP